MEQNTERLNPSAQCENNIIGLEQRLEKQLKDVHSFNNSITNINEMITYFEN